MNAVHLIGRLGADPELRVTQGGTSVGKFSLAIPRIGGQEKVTDWFDIVCFGKTAEAAGQHLKKGARVGAAGRLQQETWQDKQSGQNRSRVVVIADQLDIIDWPDRGGGGQQDPVPFADAEPSADW